MEEPVARSNSKTKILMLCALVFVLFLGEGFTGIVFEGSELVRSQFQDGSMQSVKIADARTNMRKTHLVHNSSDAVPTSPPSELILSSGEASISGTDSSLLASKGEVSRDINIARQFNLYEYHIFLGIRRARDSPGSEQQVRHTIQRTPMWIKNTNYYVYDAMLQPEKQQVTVSFLHSYSMKTRPAFRVAYYRRLPKRFIGDPVEKVTRFYVRDCRVRSLVTGELFGNHTYKSTVDDDETTIYWEEQNKTTADHKPLVAMIPCGKCKIERFVDRRYTYNKMKFTNVACKLEKWVQEIISQHAASGVFQFDLGIHDYRDSPVNGNTHFEPGPRELALGKEARKWPTLPGVTLDVPLTSYAHNNFREAPFVGNPVDLNKNRSGKIAACVTVSAAKPRLLLTHFDMLIKSGVDHVFYLPMVVTDYGSTTLPAQETLTDPEQYLKTFLELQAAMGNRPGLSTFAKQWMFPELDISTPHFQILAINQCYSHAMSVGYDWVFVLDVDEFLMSQKLPSVHYPISSLQTLQSTQEPASEPLLRKLVKQYDPLDVCTLDFARVRYQEQQENDDKPPILVTLGNKTLIPKRPNTPGKSLFGRNVRLASIHTGFCANVTRPVIKVSISDMQLIHIHHVFIDPQFDD